MPRIRKASGGIVQALKAYDRNIRVRWSWEKNMWAIEAPIKSRLGLVPPVIRRTVPGTKQVVSEKLPERSDRRITYNDGMQLILWTPVLDWNVYLEVVRSDTHKYKSRNELYDRVNNIENEGKSDAERESKDRAKEARKFYNWSCNKNLTSY